MRLAMVAHWLALCGLSSVIRKERGLSIRLQRLREALLPSELLVNTDTRLKKALHLVSHSHDFPAIDDHLLLPMDTSQIPLAIDIIDLA